MSDLSTMKARIASELRRSNIDTQIASAITTAIQAYQHERWWFNETRSIIFSTVADQYKYDETDDTDLGNVQRFDYVHATISDSVYTLGYMTPAQLERLNSDGNTTGQPLSWSYYQNEFLLYPIPSDAYTITIGGVIAKSAPASDVETGNVWMIEGEKLIRCRAKYEIYQHVLMDPIQAATFNPDNDMGPTGKAYSELLKKSNWLINQGGDYCVEPTCF